MNKKRDLVFILLWPILGSIISLLVKANYFISIIIFFGIPAAYLSYKTQKFIKKIALFSAVLAIPLTIVIDYVMEITGGWFTPSSIFGSFRLFGYVMIDDLVWAFLYVYLVAIFYEYFLDEKCTPKLYYPRLKYLFIGTLFILGIFIFLYNSKPSLLQIDYFYLKVGVVLGLIPIILLLLNFPKLYAKFFKTAAYFFFLTFVFEITALKLGQWTFPASNQFIGFVSILGTHFPLEELFFWVVLGALAVLSYYELFDEK